METLGYGEDALTYWCLTRRLGSILSPFHDTIANTQVVFYRPSFGRRSKGSAAIPGIRGPQFGEFDGIIVTSRGVYLIEAKWTNSGELDDATVTLRREQVRRHRSFVLTWRLGALTTRPTGRPSSRIARTSPLAPPLVLQNCSVQPQRAPC
jgi:hypothetical protein